MMKPTTLGAAGDRRRLGAGPDGAGQHGLRELAPRRPPGRWWWSPMRTQSQPEVEHWSAGRKRAKDLEDEDSERRRWPARQPLDREHGHGHDFDD